MAKCRNNIRYAEIKPSDRSDNSRKRCKWLMPTLAGCPIPLGAFSFWVFCEAGKAKLAAFFHDPLGNLSGILAFGLIGAAFIYLGAKVIMAGRIVIHSSPTSMINYYKPWWRNMLPPSLIGMCVASTVLWCPFEGQTLCSELDFWEITNFWLGSIVVIGLIYGWICHCYDPTDSYMLTKVLPSLERCSDLNTEVIKFLKRIEKADYIFISAIHFCDIVADEDLLTAIYKKNKNARIFFLPMLPYAATILQRSAVLGRNHKRDYVSACVRSINSIASQLSATGRVRLACDDDVQRMVIWGRLKASHRGNLQDPTWNNLDPTKFVKEYLGEGGAALVQHYPVNGDGHFGEYWEFNRQDYRLTHNRLFKDFSIRWNAALPPDRAAIEADPILLKRLHNCVAPGLLQKIFGTWDYEKIFHQNRKLASFFESINDAP